MIGFKVWRQVRQFRCRVVRKKHGGCEMTTSNIRRLLSAAAATTLTTVALSAALSPAQAKRVQQAATVLSEIHKVPDKDIPQDLWNKAACVMVVPDMKKAAFVVGGEYGKGLMSCRNAGHWSAPVF